MDMDNSQSGITTKQHQAKIKTIHNICPVCKIKKFCFRRDLIKHVQQYHRHIKMLKCRHCKFLCSDNQSLTRHIRTHKECFKIRHICEYCSKPFESVIQLHQHLMVHMQRSEEGDYAFNKNSNTSQTSARCHSNLRKQNYANLKKHKKMHLKERKGARCNTRSLEHHAVISTKRTKQPRLGCKQVFKHKFYLKRHIKRSHLKLKPNNWTCELCSEIFQERYQYNDHLNSHKNCDKIGNPRNDIDPLNHQDLKTYAQTNITKTETNNTNNPVFIYYKKVKVNRRLKTFHSEERIDSKTSEPENLKTKVNKENDTSFKNDKEDLLLSNNIEIKTVQTIAAEFSSKRCNKIDKSRTISPKVSKNINQLNKQYFRSKLPKEEYELNLNKTRRDFKQNKQSCLNKDQEAEFELNLSKVFKDLQHSKQNYQSEFELNLSKVSKDLQHSKQNYQLKDQQNDQSSFNKCQQDENIEFDIKDVKDKTNIYKEELLNKNQEKILNYKITYIDSNDSDDDYSKKRWKSKDPEDLKSLNSLENNQLTMENNSETLSLDSVLEEDTFRDHQSVPLKVEYFSDNSQEDFGLHSVLEISKTELSHDKALVDSAKRKKDVCPVNNLTLEDENSNTNESQKELQVFNNKNYITKLKLRYKLLKGKCTICNKIFACPDDFVGHALEFHPTPGAFKSLPCTSTKSLTHPEHTKSSSLSENVEKNKSNQQQKNPLEQECNKNLKEAGFTKENNSIRTIRLPTASKVNHSNLPTLPKNKVNKKDTLHKYMCKVCPREFRLEHHLRQHERVHAGDYRIKRSKTTSTTPFFFNSTNKSTPSTPSSSTVVNHPFLIPTIKVNDIVTYDSLSNNYRSQAHEVITSDYCGIDNNEEEFISLLDNDHIKEEKIIDGY